MKNQNYSISFAVNQSPEQVFNAINNVRGWWSGEIEGETDTDIVFDVLAKDGKTEVRFTHVGLAPQIECYGSCSNAWSMLVNGNLRKLITTGKTQPDVFA